MPNAPTSPVPSSPSFQRASRTTQRPSSLSGSNAGDETSTHDGASVKSDATTANATTDLFTGGRHSEADDDDGIDEITNGDGDMDKSDGKKMTS